MTDCPICRCPLEASPHGRCIVQLIDMYRVEVTRLRNEIDRLRSIVIDAGILRKDQL